MIEVKNLSKKFGHVLALENISFSVQKGQVVGFLGANGAGKTTTMDILCGCMGADRGSVEICGVDILDKPLDAKSRIGYLPDTPPLYNDMLVGELVEYSAKIHGVSQANVGSYVSQALDKLSLMEVKGRLVGNLSKGYRQRVAFACAVVHKPEVLILDEPTEGLDPNQIAQMREFISSLRQEHTILLSSHILNEVENLCDSLVVINQGRIVAQDSYENIMSDFSANTYELKVSSSNDKGVSNIMKIAGVRDFKELEQGHFVFGLEGEASLDDVLKLALEYKMNIISAGPSSSNLEDIFQKLTQN